jgi:hypothetical protein
MEQQRQSTDHYTQTRAKFVAWLAMTPAERSMNDMPKSKAAFARHFDVGERTLDKWQVAAKDEVEALKVKKAAQSGSAYVPSLGDLEQMSNAELLADIIRKQLIAAAKGDDSAMNFLRANQSILKPLIDALNEEFVSDFETASDSELVERFVDSFEVECVLALRSRNWVVEKP